MYADKEILEFPKILNKLKQFAVTDLAKIDIMTIEPSTNLLLIQTMLSEIEMAKIAIERLEETPLTGVLNIKEALSRARVGSVLSIDELLKIVSHEEAVARSERYLRKIKQLEISFGLLSPYYDSLEPHPAIRKAINECISQKGEIYDNASMELARIRKKVEIAQKRIEDKMESMLRSEASKLTDSIITIRNNRLVLPVKSEYKNSFQGIVHDQSASKETVFMEPMACVHLNNDLQTLLLEEEQEIERILMMLSALVQEEVASYEENLSVFTSLDIIYAKAKYAHEISANTVTFADTIDLKNARHPLIKANDVVANTIFFDQYKTIVITGPNTGGKTVALKTLGLLALMLQSGMQIPVDEGSKTRVFSNVFADIGDEQSIEQSLSTFSSHITKIIYILRHLTKESLILLDELGSGTDPKEGASLAMSLLDHIRAKHVYAMVTTHYPELKLYAYSHFNAMRYVRDNSQSIISIYI
ncbi:MAG: hypothetical protein EOM23_04385 [Candidatus Moranbacteria bacterium]|nr:hypothetical protein [Candidatus Moranbacteria bacterium]